ncbi:MAG: winged helix-turn-helix transcriptional regulator [Rhizobiales bacterium]|nr:winged helix-turn-helix transcriptional regulator [Hyphomicrobiales bacterium]
MDCRENVVIDNNLRQAGCAKEMRRKRTGRTPMKRRRPVASTAKPGLRRSAASPVRAEKLDFGQLNHHLGFFLRRLQIWVFQDFIQTLAPMKIRPAQYSVLLIIEANPGRSQAAVGQTLGIERARLARLLHELERRQWVTRRANGSDARSHSLYLTPDGENALTTIKSLAERHERQLIRLLGAKRHKQLIDSLHEYG